MRILSCLVLALGVSLPSTFAAAGELKVGDAAPDFSLVGSDGETYKLSDFRDKQAVVVAWFPKAFTGGCTKECKSLKENGAAVRAFDVAYFTASCDDAKTNAAFAKSLDLDYPILSDPEKKAAQAYGVVTASRKVPFRWTFFIGKDGKILHIDKQVQTTTHAEDIAKKLGELDVSMK